MENQNIKSRKEKMKDDFLDTGAAELTEAGKEIIHTLMQDINEWVINQYSIFKSTPSVDTKVELKKLEMQIAISNETVEIGMKKKEIAVMWAMRKLGYSEEETQQVMNLANEAYKPKK